MIEIVSVEQLKSGDIILLEDYKENHYRITSITGITEDGLILLPNGMDVSPEERDIIIRLGSKKKTICIDIYEPVTGVIHKNY